jgi:hypothetical protein
MLEPQRFASFALSYKLLTSVGAELHRSRQEEARTEDVDQNEPNQEAQEGRTMEDQQEGALEVQEGRALAVHQHKTQVSSLHLKCTHGHGNEADELRRCPTWNTIRRHWQKWTWIVMSLIWRHGKNKQRKISTSALQRYRKEDQWHFNSKRHRSVPCIRNARMDMEMRLASFADARPRALSGGARRRSDRSTSESAQDRGKSIIQYAHTHVDIVLTNFVDAPRQFGAGMHTLRMILLNS